MINKDSKEPIYDVDTHLNMILKIHNTLNMIRDKTGHRRKGYTILKQRAAEGEENVDSSVSVVKQRAYPHCLLKLVLEGQQIDTLQRTLKDEKEIFFNEQIRILENRNKKRVFTKGRPSQSKSSDDLEESKFLIQGTPLAKRPGTAESVTANTRPPTRELSPFLYSKDAFRTRHGMHHFNAQRELVLKPETHTLNNKKKAGVVQLVENNPKWQYVREKEINKWEKLEDLSKIEKNDTEAREARDETANVSKERPCDTSDCRMYAGDSGENSSAGVMKYFYAPFHWMRKSF